MAEIHEVVWDEYRRLCEDLVLKVAESGWEFDTLLCLSRGGLRPGDYFSRVFGKPLLVLAASSYRENEGRSQGELRISGCVTGGEPAGRVLVVDDLADSGVTLGEIVKFIAREFPAVTEIRTATIWVKGCSVVVPDYYVSFLPGSPWILQPFEVYEDIGPEGLRRMREEREARGGEGK